MQKKVTGNEAFGVAAGLVVCGVVLLTFPKYVGMVPLLAYVFYGIGLIALLLGIMGCCIEGLKK